jgi:hypothetical protein
MAAASISAEGVRAVAGQMAGGGLLAPGATRSAEEVILFFLLLFLFVCTWVARELGWFGSN